MEFQEVMRQWKRMCVSFDLCEKCSLYWSGKCAFNDLAENMGSFALVEKHITEWAAEHPEPVFPSWSEWLISNGVMLDATEIMRETGSIISLYGEPVKCIPTSKCYEPIPADIAEKLGIEPKNDN